MNSPTNPALSAAPAPLSTPPPHRLSTPDEQLAVAFTWQSDRYAHVIESPGRKTWCSSEGLPTEDWPLSPAISQLSTETIEGRPTVLGVGCSGTTHFSVSVQTEADETGNLAIRFDWAARLSRPLSADDAKAAWLGSTYLSNHAQFLIEPLENAVCPSPSSIQPVCQEQVRTVQWSYRIRQS